VDRHEVSTTWPRPPHMVRTKTTVAADGGSIVLRDEPRTQETPIERSPSSRFLRRIAVTQPSVQRMDRSWGRMASALASMNRKLRMTKT